MKRKHLVIIVLPIIIMAVVTGLVLALSEAEPNDSPAQANPLPAREEMDGAIDPNGDVDYYAQEAITATWGYIALLRTEASTTSVTGTLTAYRSDGTTILQSDTGSWEHGSGIALQNYADGSTTHYLSVREAGDDDTITPYTLRYYHTVIAAKPEIEPNETRSTGTPSSFTHEGRLLTTDDQDCFAFHGRDKDNILVALDGDPEGNGSPADLMLKLVDASDVTVKSVDVTGIGGDEFLDYVNLAGDGLYAYCLSVVGGTGSISATYRIGILRNGILYSPGGEEQAVWLNPPPDGSAVVGDILSFRLAMTNTSPVEIPDYITMRAFYSGSCMEFVDASLPPTSVSPGDVRWVDLQSGLAPGEVYTITANFQATSVCSDVLHQNVVFDYYFEADFGSDAPYVVTLPPYFLPVFLRWE